MKEKFKHWAWRTLLTLTCLLITTPAWADFTIYVNSTSGDNCIYLWGGTPTNNWPGTQLKNYSTITKYGKTWYVISITSSYTKYILNNGNGGDDNQTNDLEASQDVYVEYNGGGRGSETYPDNSAYLDNYYATGDNAAVFGTAWSPTAKLMTNDYNGNWTWTSDEFQMNEGSTIGFKVVKNGTDWIPSGEGNETKKTAPATGTYKLKVTYELGASASDGELIPIDVAPSAPVFSLESGSYDTNQSVTISSTAGATIYYTTDGSDPTTSSAVYSGAIALEDEGNYTIKAIAVNDYGTSSVATAEYTIAYKDIYLFGSVGIQHAWNFSNGNYKLVTADGITYTGAYRVNKNTAEDVGYFILGSAEDITWGDQRMIGSDADGDNWDIIDSNLGSLMNTVAGSKKPWKVTTGEGVYEFDFNRVNNTLVVTKFQGGTSIFVYDYARPYIYPVEELVGRN